MAQTVTVVGGIHRIDYSRKLKELGFGEVYQVKDRKDLKKMPGLVRKSDLTVIISGCCSHEHSDLAKRVSESEGVPYKLVPGGAGPANIVQHLKYTGQYIDRYV
ncbi:MAG: hypothetical protein ACQESG_07785 [Nanobdellota archaeon]